MRCARLQDTAKSGWSRRSPLLIGADLDCAFRPSRRPAIWRTVFNDTSILIILALGQMVVILTRSIDLSMASNLAFTGMVVAHAQRRLSGDPGPAADRRSRCSSALVLGAINGLLVWKLDIPSIVVTLGTLTIYRGATFVLSGGAWVNADQMSPDFIGFQRADPARHCRCCPGSPSSVIAAFYLS